MTLALGAVALTPSAQASESAPMPAPSRARQCAFDSDCIINDRLPRQGVARRLYHHRLGGQTNESHKSEERASSVVTRRIGCRAARSVAFLEARESLVAQHFEQIPVPTYLGHEARLVER